MALLAVSWTVKIPSVSIGCTVAALGILFFTLADSMPVWRTFQKRLVDWFRRLAKRSTK
jgi:hypothetical protein